MEELVRYIITNIVEDKDSVKVSVREDGDVSIIDVNVADNDMGKVIGRQGKIAKSIRALMKAYATKQGLKINVDIMD